MEPELHAVVPHWVYAQLTRRQQAGSETGVGSNVEERFNSYMLLDIFLLQLSQHEITFKVSVTFPLFL